MKPRARARASSSALVITADSAALEQRIELEHLVDHVRQCVARARAPRTLHEYGKHWRRFAAWCAARALPSLPCSSATLCLYVAERAQHVRIASLAVELAAVAWNHEGAGLPSPLSDPQVRLVWDGLRRLHGVARRQVAPLTAAELRGVCAALPATLAGLRDRALLLVGMGAALRRSELAALEVDDLEVRRDGLVVHVRRSKTDQEAQGVEVGVARGRLAATCPVRALEAWLRASGLRSGPLFRAVLRSGALSERALTGRSVASIVQRSVERVGLDARRYSGHSLRSGLATTAARAGKSDRAIMLQGRWSGRKMVDTYVRAGQLLGKDNASRDIGL